MNNIWYLKQKNKNLTQAVYIAKLLLLLKIRFHLDQVYELIPDELYFGRNLISLIAGANRNVRLLERFKNYEKCNDCQYKILAREKSVARIHSKNI